MSSLQLTRAAIIAEGLALAGRPDLTADARLWLTLYLEKQYFNQDFDWLVKITTGITVANGTAIPTDYRASRSATLVDTATSSRSEVQVLVNKADFDNRRVGLGSSTGLPRFAYVDHNLRTWTFLPSPVSGYTMDLHYYYIPDISDFTSATDTAVPKWGLPMEILVDHIKARAMEYNDDARQDAAMGGVEKSVTAAKFNNQDKRAGSSRFALGKRFRNRFR